MKNLLTLKEAADLLGVSKETMRRLDRSGELHAVIISRRGDRRYKMEDLEKFIMNNNK